VKPAEALEVALRHSEGDRDRLDLIDADDAGGGAGGHHVTRIDQPHADPAIHRRGDPAIAHVDLCGLHGALVGEDGPLLLLDGGGLVLGSLPGDRVLCDQGLEADEVAIGPFERGLVALQRALGLG
jgi:hypothetical protein